MTVSLRPAAIAGRARDLLRQRLALAAPTLRIRLAVRAQLLLIRELPAFLLQDGFVHLKNP